MTAQTPIYGIKYLVQGEPVRNTRQALEDNAKTIESALAARGVTPPNTPDLAALAGRVTVLETVGAWTDLPVVGAPYLAHFPFNSQAGPGQGATPQKIQFRVQQGRVWFRGWGVSSAGYNAGGGTGANPLLVSPLQAAYRPPVTASLVCVTLSGTISRHEISPAGQMHSSAVVPGGTYLCFDGLSYSLS